MAWFCARLNKTFNIIHTRPCLLTIFDPKLAIKRLKFPRSTLRRTHYTSGVCLSKHGQSEDLASQDGQPTSTSKMGDTTFGDVPWDLLQQTNHKMVGLSREQQKQLLRQEPSQPRNPQLLKVALIGAPNAGKSTLANQLTGWRFAAVSSKVHTTRKKTTGVLTEDNKQVFLDTPGMINQGKAKRHNLQRSLLADPHSSLYEADLIVVLADVSQVWYKGSLDGEVLKALHLHRGKKSVLVLNKVDKLGSKQELLHITRMLTEGVVAGKKEWHTAKTKPDIDSMMDRMQSIHTSAGEESTCDDGTQKPDDDETLGAALSDINEISKEKEMDSDVVDFAGRNLRDPQEWQSYERHLRSVMRDAANFKGWAGFDRVFMLSALSGDGVEELREFLLTSAKPGPWLYHHAVVTDQDPVQMARQCVWEKVLEYLPREIPYTVTVEKAAWEIDEDDVLRTAFVITCTGKRHMVHVLGKGGDIIRKIADEAKTELMNTFRRDLSLKLSVRLKGQPESWE